ncbi:LOW QUALITY PROTEIN: PDZ domain-containing protein 11-like [Entelurus aequoreus]|uniref:LOW QUALITY PROTEIN: PDZ domain-containing protein 11-like n=1 Tax=Entelurus aequoreus TaxID=161455 RepID=UPI002B1CED02|nr:LOW QUALITY PROTEIN: PDZ domain-containing protein 11-like [Entelurus aequoreus]
MHPNTSCGLFLVEWCSSFENPPAWIPPSKRIHHPNIPTLNKDLTQFLPRTIVLNKPPGTQHGFNSRGGKPSQSGVFIYKVVPDSDAHHAGRQEVDQVLSVKDVHFQDIEHSRTKEQLIVHAP